MKGIGLLLLTSAIGISTMGVTGNRAANYPVEKATFKYAPIGRGEHLEYSADVYFSRNYFEHSATEYDPHLATASLSMAISTFTFFGPYTDEWYQNQPRFVRGFFDAIHFNTFTTNEDFVTTATFDTIGLCAAKREFNDYTVVAVTPRSGGYMREWANNMHLGDGSKSDYMHEGWYNAANKLIRFVQNYVVENNVKGKIKLWMSGFSRGGATTNIAAALIDNKLNNGEQLFSNGATLNKDDVFAYTFEAPQGGNVNVKNIKKPKDSLYNNIFNVINPLDIVPKLAMKEYGFTRFGRDKYVTNQFYDPNNYEANRRTFKALLDRFNFNQVKAYNDDFVMGGFSIGKGGIDIISTIIRSLAGSEMMDIVKSYRDVTKQNYDANIAGAIIIEELTSHIGDRKEYVRKYQTPLERMMLILQDEHIQDPGVFSTAIKLIFIGGIVKAVTGTLVSAKDAIKKICNAKYADEVSDLMSVLASPLASTYWERPNELFSFAGFMGGIMQNHYPDFNLAHLASQDSYHVSTLSDKSLKVIPFIDNADYGRMKFFGYNDIGLRLESKKGTRVINIDGHYAGKSDIRDCNLGYAAGYYSYATEEKMELFMPINRKYNISMKSYSKKPYHRCEYWAYYEFFTLDNSGSVRNEKDHKKENVCFASDRHKRDVTINK